MDNERIARALLVHLVETTEERDAAVAHLAKQEADLEKVKAEVAELAALVKPPKKPTVRKAAR